MEHLNPVEDTKTFVSFMYNVSLDSIQMALALTVALAWYAFIKGGINKLWPERSDKFWALGGFAVIITAIFAAVLIFFKNILKKQPTQSPVIYAVTSGAM